MILGRKNNLDGHLIMNSDWISVHLLGNVSNILVNLLANDFPNMGRFPEHLQVPMFGQNQVAGRS